MHFGLTSSVACFTLLRATFAFWRWVPSSVPACTEIDAHGCIVRCSTLNTRRCDGSRSFLRCCCSLSMVNYLIGLAGVIGFTYLLRCYRLCNRSSFSFRSMMTLISVSICWVRNMIRDSTFHCKWINIGFLGFFLNSKFYILNRFFGLFRWIHTLFARIGRCVQRLKLSKARASRCHQVSGIANALISLSFRSNQFSSFCSEILNSSHVDESDSLLLGDEALSTAIEMPQVSISPSGGRKDDLPA